MVSEMIHNITHYARKFNCGRTQRRLRRGIATLDYFLVLCVVLPLATFLFWIGPQIISSVYDMFTVIVAGPFALVGN
jgi:hypothetical protein